MNTGKKEALEREKGVASDLILRRVSQLGAERQ